MAFYALAPPLHLSLFSSPSSSLFFLHFRLPPFSFLTPTTLFLSYNLIKILPPVYINEDFALLLEVLGSARIMEGKVSEACSIFEHCYRVLQLTLNSIEKTS